MAATTPTTIKKLPGDALVFVDNFVSMKFLQNYGTRSGFNEFCKVAMKAGALKKCGNGAKRDKEAWATYIYNAVSRGAAGGLWNLMVDEWDALDDFSKSGMASQIAKGKGLSLAVKKKLDAGTVYSSCTMGKTSVPELKDMIMQADKSVKEKDLKGLKKPELCALLDGILGPDKGKQWFEFGTQKGEPIAWKDWPFKPEEIGHAAQLEKAYEKHFGLIPAKDKAAVLAKLLEGELPEDYPTPPTKAVLKRT